MATQREIYDKFMQYWNQQMATVADQPANVQQAYAQQLSAQYYNALEESEKEKLKNEAEKRQDKQALAGIAAAIGGPVAGYYGLQVAKDGLFSSVGGEVANQTAQQVAANTASNVASSTASNVAPTAVGSAPLADGTAGVLMSDGTVVPADATGIGAGTIGTVLSAAAAAKGGYDAFKGAQQGGEGVRSGLTTMGAGIGSMIAPGLGTAAGAAAGNLAGYGLQGDGVKNDLALAALVGPVTAPLMLLGGGDFLRNNLIRKTGRQLIQERLNNLKDQGVATIDPMREEYGTYGLSKEDLVKRAQEMGELGNVDFAKTRDEKYLRATDTVGGLPWWEALGDDYINKATHEQRLEANRRALEQGLFDERRGQLYADKDKLKSIFQGVVGSEDPPTTNVAQVPVATPQIPDLKNDSRMTNYSAVQRPTPENMPPNNFPGNRVGLMNLGSEATDVYNKPQSGIDMSGIRTLPGRLEPSSPIAQNLIGSLQQGGAQMPANLIALGQSQRPIGFDEDPNRPGHYIRRV